MNSLISNSLTSSTVANDSNSIALEALRSQPETAAYFDLSCEEEICDTISQSLELFDLPDFFTS